MSGDPIAEFQRLLRRAREAQIPLPERMALATADGQGRPSVRFVLLKQVDERGFVFFTDDRSHKGRDLEANPRAAAAFYWNPLGKQVRVEGTVEPVSRAEADAYWETRPRGKRLAARASRQSAPLVDRKWLLARWETMKQKFRGVDVSRPPYWQGFRIVPESIEFWTHREHRLHQRELFVRSGRSWKKRLLQP